MPFAKAQSGYDHVCMRLVRTCAQYSMWHRLQRAKAQTHRVFTLSVEALAMEEGKAELDVKQAANKNPRRDRGFDSGSPFAAREPGRRATAPDALAITIGRHAKR